LASLTDADSGAKPLTNYYMKKIYLLVFCCVAAVATTATAHDASNLRASEESTDAEWVDLTGKALYTDSFTDIFAANGEEKVYDELEVSIQQNVADPTLYRLVNPYKEWKNPYSASLVYDDSKDYYLELYTLPEEGNFYIKRFETGLMKDGTDMFGIVSDVDYYSDFYSVEYLNEKFAGLFGTYEDGVLTYAAKYSMEGYDFATLNSWLGTYNPSGSVTAVNESGNFKVVLPTSTVGVYRITTTEISSPEYYNIQGEKISAPKKGEIVIVKNGGKTMKVLY
jgi:hypothetical protein